MFYVEPKRLISFGASRIASSDPMFRCLPWGRSDQSVRAEAEGVRSLGLRQLREIAPQTAAGR